MIFIQIFVILLSAILGLFVFFNPRKVIAMQIHFYEKINWKMEPISMDKEIRNTRIMGSFLILLGLFVAIYLVFLQG
ncbi:MAG: hypothetical protein PHY94_06495 [Candidatus Omnitrophica bacterium]|nr:hypothetical protein [Candidatus Omnitrophota bacterium]